MNLKNEIYIIKFRLYFIFETKEFLAVCPTGFIFFKDDCYGFIVEKATWEIANGRCKGIYEGATLAVIESDHVNDFLATQLKYKLAGSDSNFWIGLKDLGGKLSWIDPDQFWMPEYLEGYTDQVDLNS